jgi:hypothetical protein
MMRRSGWAARGIDAGRAHLYVGTSHGGGIEA